MSFAQIAAMQPLSSSYAAHCLVCSVAFTTWKTSTRKVRPVTTLPDLSAISACVNHDGDAQSHYITTFTRKMLYNSSWIWSCLTMFTALVRGGSPSRKSLDLWTLWTTDISQPSSTCSEVNQAIEPGPLGSPGPLGPLRHWIWRHFGLRVVSWAGHCTGREQRCPF